MGEIKQVDLSNVVNNKITYGKNDIVDEFSGLDGNYIDRDILARIWESAVGKFFILNDGFYDNIECDGQTLQIDQYIKKLYFLGFFFWGKNTERIIVEFEDGVKEIISVTFEDWTVASSDDKSIFKEYSDGKYKTTGLSTIRRRLRSRRSACTPARTRSSRPCSTRTSSRPKTVTMAARIIS